MDKKATRYRVEEVYIKEITVIYHLLRSMTMDIFYAFLVDLLQLIAAKMKGKMDRERETGERKRLACQGNMMQSIDILNQLFHRENTCREYIFLYRSFSLRFCQYFLSHIKYKYTQRGDFSGNYLKLIQLYCNDRLI